jgi:hypothetical protein
MRFFDNDVVLLLGFLLLFCLGLTFFRSDHPDAFFGRDPFDGDSEEYVNEKTANPAPTAVLMTADESDLARIDAVPSYSRPDARLADLSQEQLLTYMRPLFLTKSASAIISFLNHIPSASVFRIVKAVVESPKLHLPPRVKLRVIFAGAQRQKDRSGKFEFFDLVVHNQHLQTGVKPLIVKAVEAGYAHLVPDILEWAQQAHVGNVVQEALFYVAHYDDEDPEALRELFEAGVPIRKSVASELLWELVDTCADGHSLPFLVHELSADVQYVKDGKTPLVKAIQNNKLSIVKLLLELGAQPDFKATMTATEKTALDVARETGNQQLVTLLARYVKA